MITKEVCGCGNVQEWKDPAISIIEKRIKELDGFASNYDKRDDNYYEFTQKTIELMHILKQIKGL